MPGTRRGACRCEFVRPIRSRANFPNSIRRDATRPTRYRDGQISHDRAVRGKSRARETNGRIDGGSSPGSDFTPREFFRPPILGWVARHSISEHPASNPRGSSNVAGARSNQASRCPFPGSPFKTNRYFVRAGRPTERPSSRGARTQVIPKFDKTDSRACENISTCERRLKSRDPSRPTCIFRFFLLSPWQPRRSTRTTQGDPSA